MRNNQAKRVALGGVLASLAVVIMCLGGMIPVATYVCPALCMVLLCWIVQLCCNTVAWTWFVAVSVLSLLLGPDKEAAVVFVFIGSYPIIKPRLDSFPLGWILKLLFFNVMILVSYSLLIYVLGMDQILSELRDLGAILTGVTVLLGNVTLFLLDRLLSLIQRKVHRV